MKMLLQQKIEEQLVKAEEKGGRLPLREKALKLLIGFFVLMILLTILSRTADSITVAKVEVSQPKGGSLSFDITGTGKIEAGQMKTVGTQPDIRVEEVLAEAGQPIKAGEPLYRLNMEDVTDKLIILKNELKSLQLDLKLETVSTASHKSEAETAQIKLEYAKQDLENIQKEQQYQCNMAQADLITAQKDLEKAQKDYEKSLLRTKETLLEDKSTAYTDAVTALADAQYNYEKEKLDAQRKVQDAQKALDKLNNKDSELKEIHAFNRYNDALQSGDEDRIKEAEDNLNAILYGTGGPEDRKNERETAQLELKRAKDDQKMIQSKWEASIAEKEEKLAKAEKEFNEVKQGTYDFEQELKSDKAALETAQKEIETKNRAITETQHTKEVEIEKAQRAIEEAQTALEQAQKSDEITAKTNAEDSQKAQYRKEKMKLMIEAKNNEIAKLTQIKKRQGVINSPVNGTVDTISVEAGKRTANEDGVSISCEDGGYYFRGKIESDMADYIAIGDSLKILLKGKTAGINSTIEGIQFLKDSEEVEVTVRLPEGDYIPGASASLEMNKTTDIYRTTLPLQAVREGSEGKYVLIVQQRDTILGKEMIAVKRSVSVTDHDSKNAAVDTFLMPDDLVIKSSNKPVSEGDRVRVEKKEE